LKSKSNFVSVLASSALLVVSAQANAFTTSVTAGSFSAQSGAFNIDFGTSTVNNSTPIGGTGSGADSVLAGSGGGVSYAYTGGALYNISTSPISSVTARPPGSTGNFYSVGTSPAAQTGPGQVAFNSGLSYFGFLWGSPDTYNTVSFYNGNTLLGSFNGSAVLNPANGNQAVGKYFNAFAGIGEQITHVKFASTGNAFETDNHSYVSAVPEPETYAMLMAGLGLLGFMAKRKKSL